MELTIEFFCITSGCKQQSFLMCRHLCIGLLASISLALISSATKSSLQSCSAIDAKSLNCEKAKNKYTVQEFTDEELFTRGHLKPFGSHRPPDEIVEELPFMISPQDFYMNYVVKHKPVVIKGKLCKIYMFANLHLGYLVIGFNVFDYVR